MGVEAVILFGSRALGLARPNSDFDIGILINDARALSDYKRYGSIYQQLYDIFSLHAGKLATIDIVFLQKAPAELRAHVAKHGQVIYEGDPKKFSNFRAKVMDEYADFEPIRNMFHSAILARVS